MNREKLSRACAGESSYLVCSCLSILIHDNMIKEKDKACADDNMTYPKN